MKRFQFPLKHGYQFFTTNLYNVESRGVYFTSPPLGVGGGIISLGGRNIFCHELFITYIFHYLFEF